MKTRKLSYHKDDRAMRPIYGAKFLGVPDYFYKKNLTGFVRMEPLNVPAKFEVRSFTRS